MSNIATHFDQMMDADEQERIGATADKPEHMRVMRTLDHYGQMLAALREIADQKTSDEIEADHKALLDDYGAHDFEAGYDTAIRKAREAVGRSNTQLRDGASRSL